MRRHRGPRRGRLLRASWCVCVYEWMSGSVGGGSGAWNGQEKHAMALSSTAVAVVVELLCVVCGGEADVAVRSSE